MLDSYNGAFGVERHGEGRIRVVVVLIYGRSDGEGAIASTESSRASRESAGVTTAASDTWRRGCVRGGGGEGRRVWECCSQVASSRSRWGWSIKTVCDSAVTGVCVLTMHTGKCNEPGPTCWRTSLPHQAWPPCTSPRSIRPWP